MRPQDYQELITENNRRINYSIASLVLFFILAICFINAWLWLGVTFFGFGILNSLFAIFFSWRNLSHLDKISKLAQDEAFNNLLATMTGKK